MLHPGLYEQVINNALESELSEIPEARKSTAPIDTAEASKVLAQYLTRLEQELKYALAYAALVSAAANGRVPRDICQRTNVGYARKCGVLRREV